MFDRPSITSGSERCYGSRFLRATAGGVYQTLYYRGLSRTDRTAYAGFAAGNPAMDAAAGRLLRQMVDEDEGRGTRAQPPAPAVRRRGGNPGGDAGGAGTARLRRPP